MIPNLSSFSLLHSLPFGFSASILLFLLLIITYIFIYCIYTSQPRTHFTHSFAYNLKMLAMEEVLCELSREDINEQGLPPGFRFHPTDEELITFYLASKVFHGSFCGVEIAEVDLNRCEPWELPDVAKMGEREWYFFSLRDRKYPTGLRTNRATGAGYWKATGKDREVHSASSGALLGMKKTLVFYKGRAPRGEKTKWVMHEYRLDGDFSYRHTCKEEWVICRIFHKTGEKKNPMFQGQAYLLGSSPAAAAATTSLPALLESQTTLLESQPHPALQGGLASSFLVHHHHDQESNELKALINPVVSQTCLAFPINSGFQSCSFPTTPTITTTTTNTTTTPATSINKINANTGNNNPSTSILFKSLLSHQECSLKEQTTIPKQCKTEANFSHFQLPDANMHWVDRMHTNLYQNPLFFEMDYCSGGVLGFTAAATDGAGGGGGGASAAAPAVASAENTVHEMSTSIAFNRAGFQMMVDLPSRVPGGESWPLDS